MTNDTKTTPRYRFINEGERIEKGDEHLCDDAETWAPITGLFVGMEYTRLFQPARRAIRKPTDGQ